MKAGGIVGEGNRFAGWGEQREVCARPVKKKSEFPAADRGVAPHERELRIDLTGKNKIRVFLTPERQQIERQVGITAQAVRMPFVGSMSNELPDHVDAAIEHILQGVGIVCR